MCQGVTPIWYFYFSGKVPGRYPDIPKPASTHVQNNITKLKNTVRYLHNCIKTHEKIRRLMQKMTDLVD